MGLKNEFRFKVLNDRYNTIYYAVDDLENGYDVHWTVNEIKHHHWYKYKLVETSVEKGIWIIEEGATKDNSLYKSKFEQLEKDFIALERNYEATINENDKLTKQLDNNQRYIKRLNSESQHWFELYVELLHGK